MISKAEKEVDNESPKLFKGEEVGSSSSKNKGSKKTDLSHRGRRDIDEYEYEDDLDGGLDS